MTNLAEVLESLIKVNGKIDHSHIKIVKMLTQRIELLEDRLKLSNEYLYKALVAYHIARSEMTTPLGNELHSLIAHNNILLRND